MLEKAVAHAERRGMAATLEAVKKLRELRPPCGRCRRAEATKVLNLGGDGAQAVCSTCADGAKLDNRIAQQRAERERMRRGR